MAAYSPHYCPCSAPPRYRLPHRTPSSSTMPLAQAIGAFLNRTISPFQGTNPKQIPPMTTGIAGLDVSAFTNRYDPRALNNKDLIVHLVAERDRARRLATDFMADETMQLLLLSGNESRPSHCPVIYPNPKTTGILVSDKLSVVIILQYCCLSSLC